MAGDIPPCVVAKEAVFIKRLFIGWLALHILICVSVFVFYFIEGDHEQKYLEQTAEAWGDAEVLKTELSRRLSEGDLNNTSDDIEIVIAKYLSAQSLGSRNEELKWTPIQTFSFRLCPRLFQVRYIV